MTRKIAFFLVGIMSVLNIVHACTIRNITCSDIKTSSGFEFHLNSTMAVIETVVTQNETIIARSWYGKFNFLPEVVHMDNNSITTHKCCDLKVTSIIEKKGELISESCVIFNTIDDTVYTEEKEPQYSSTALKTPVGLVAVILIVLVVIVLGYIPWKKKRERKEQGVSVRLYLESIVKCYCFRKRNSDVKAHNENSTDNIHDNNVRNSEIERGLLRTDNRDEMRAEADGQNTDNAIDMDDDMTTTNDNIRVSVVSRDRIHQGMNGNLGHDPGSRRISKKHSNGNGRTLGAQSPVGQKAKGPPSPQKKRSVRSDLEEAAGGEAIELVDSLGPGSESTTSPDDVEKGLA